LQYKFASNEIGFPAKDTDTPSAVLSLDALKAMYISFSSCLQPGVLSVKNVVVMVVVAAGPAELAAPTTAAQVRTLRLMSAKDNIKVG
jgi:hypothetical protein